MAFIIILQFTNAVEDPQTEALYVSPAKKNHMNEQLLKSVLYADNTFFEESQASVEDLAELAKKQGAPTMLLRIKSGT